MISKLGNKLIYRSLGKDQTGVYYSASNLDYSPIGSVGTAGQMVAGHEIATASFPSATIGANLSWYNLADMVDASGNARVLTNNNTATFGTDILGQSSKAASLASASSQYLSSTSSVYDPGAANFTVGGWFSPTSWSAGTYGFFGQYVSAIKSFTLRNVTGVLTLLATSDGATEQTVLTYSSAGLTGWNHLAVRYVLSTKLFTLFINGKAAATGTHTGTLYSAGASRKFTIGSENTANYFNGLADEFFFCNGTAFSDNDLAKIYARKYSHNQAIAPVSQHWIVQVQAGGQTRELYDVIVDKQASDLYYDLSDEVSTTQVSLRLANIY